MEKSARDTSVILRGNISQCQAGAKGRIDRLTGSEVFPILNKISVSKVVAGVSSLTARPMGLMRRSWE